MALVVIWAAPSSWGLTLSIRATHQESGGPALVLELTSVGEPLASPSGQAIVTFADAWLSGAQPAVRGDVRELLDRFGDGGLRVEAIESAALVVQDGVWTLAADLAIRDAVTLIDRLDAAPRGVTADGPVLRSGDGRFTYYLRPRRDLRGRADNEIASIVVTPGDRAPLALAPALAPAPQDRARTSPRIRLTTGGTSQGLEGVPLARLEMSPTDAGWDLLASVSPDFDGGEGAEALQAGQIRAFEGFAEGALLAVSGRADPEVVSRLPVLGGVVSFLPRTDLDRFARRPVSLGLWSDANQDLTLVVAVESYDDPETSAAIDRFVQDAGRALKLVSIESTPFDGFRPDATRTLMLDGPIGRRLGGSLGQGARIAWSRVGRPVGGDTGDVWWAASLGSTDAHLQRLRTVWRSGDPDDQTSHTRPGAAGGREVLSLGRLSPVRIAPIAASAGTLPGGLVEAAGAFESVDWSTFREPDGSVGIRARLRTRAETGTR